MSSNCSQRSKEKWYEYFVVISVLVFEWKLPNLFLDTPFLSPNGLYCIKCVDLFVECGSEGK